MISTITISIFHYLSLCLGLDHSASTTECQISATKLQRPWVPDRLTFLTVRQPQRVGPGHLIQSRPNPHHCCKDNSISGLSTHLECNSSGLSANTWDVDSDPFFLESLEFQFCLFSIMKPKILLSFLYPSDT